VGGEKQKPVGHVDVHRVVAVVHLHNLVGWFVGPVNLFTNFSHMRYISQLRYTHLNVM
jgi:hypothetical protein